jgi:molybdate transport system substrate-binding protein
MWARSSTGIDSPRRVLLLLVVVALLTGCRPSDTSLVAAASSLRLAMPHLLQDFAARSDGGPLDATYAGSGTLRQQAEAGAPFVAMVLLGDHTDRLITAGEALADTRLVVASNPLALVGSPGATSHGFEQLGELPEGTRVAIGDPASVPAGAYARTALEHLGIWDALRGRLVYAGSVAAVLAYVERGEVDYGVVYESDLHGARNAVVLDRADPAWAPLPEVVAAAATDGGDRGRAFVRFLASPEAADVLARFGFEPRDRAP